MESKDAILKQIDGVLAATAAYNDDNFDHAGGTARLIAAIERIGAGTPYVKQAHLVQETTHWMGAAGDLRGVLKSLRADIDSGYLATLAELIHADVFADFLEMADELSSKGYKDPAAVVAGAVLEEHLRKLAQRNEIAIEDEDGKPFKADRINADLARAEIYNKLEQKNVTAWLDLRNNAAHGKYGEYDHKQVASLTSSVRDFLVKHPA